MTERAARLGGWWYLVPVGLALAAVGLLAWAAVGTVRAFADQVVPFEAGRAEVATAAGDQLWVVAPTSVVTGGVSCAVTVEGVGVSVRPLSGSTATVEGVEWSGVASFAADDGGTAVASCTTGVTDAQLALIPDPTAPGGFQDDLRSSLIRAGFGATFLLASAISTWILVRRTRSAGQ
jgi:hypothetical protein